MTTLSGEKIQNLLWEEGLDFEYTTTEDDYEAIHINCGSQQLRLEHLWPEEDGWILDVGDIVLSLFTNGKVSEVFYSPADSEESLILEIRDLYEKLS